MTQQDTQPPAETLAEAREAAAHEPTEAEALAARLDESIAFKVYSSSDDHIRDAAAMLRRLSALTRRAGGDAIPAGEGEPVAWRWERRGRFGPEIGAWEQVFTPYPPDKWPEDDRRNIVPLYATPKPPAGGDAGELAAFGASDAACTLYPGEDQAAERAAFVAGAALALPEPVVEGDVAEMDDADIITFAGRFFDPTDNGYGADTRKWVRAVRAALSEGRSHG